MIEAIYSPRGKALEYSALACNLYKGCSHGCTYCYCPMMLHMKPQEFYQPGIPRKGILEALVRDAEKYENDPRPVLLSFTSDPYSQLAENKHFLTQKALAIMAHRNLNIRVLTKNPVLAVDRDKDLLLRSKTQLGTTLVFSDDISCSKMEPGAPPSTRRIMAMVMAKKVGIPTWVSFEPVVRPVDTLEMLKQVPDFADVVKIGKWNYDKEAANIRWDEFIYEALRIVQANNLKYYFKNDLWALTGQASSQQTNMSDGELGRFAAQRFH